MYTKNECGNVHVSSFQHVIYLPLQEHSGQVEMETMRQQQQLLPVGAGSILEPAAGTSVVAAVGPAAAAACIKLLGAAAGPAEIRLPFELAELQQYSENSMVLFYFCICFLSIYLKDYLFHNIFSLFHLVKTN